MEKNKKSRRASPRTKNKSSINTLPLYVILVVFLLLYIFTQGRSISIVFGVVTFFMIIVILVMEFMLSGKEVGYGKSILEIVVAVVLILILWYALQFALQTSNPLDVVPSCSMLPALQRGDLIALHGVSGISQLKAPIINVTQSDFNSIEKGATAGELVCLAYWEHDGTVYTNQMVRPAFSVGLFSVLNGHAQQVQEGSQNSSVKYYCGEREVQFQNGTIGEEAYTTNITIDGHSVSGDLNNSIIVYRTVPKDYFYQLGDSYIVHRLYAILNVSGTYYFLTKGDNNPGLDIQYGNIPSNMSYVSGSVVLSVPYLGYVRLVLSNELAQPQGCNSTVIQ